MLQLYEILETICSNEEPTHKCKCKCSKKHEEVCSAQDKPKAEQNCKGQERLEDCDFTYPDSLEEDEGSQAHHIPSVFSSVSHPIQAVCDKTVAVAGEKTVRSVLEIVCALPKSVVPRRDMTGIWSVALRKICEIGEGGIFPA